MVQGTDLDRRRFIKYAGSGGVVALAGCGDDAGTGGEGTDPEETSEATDDATEEATEEPDEPERVQLRLTYDGHLHGRLGDAEGDRNVANYFGLAQELQADAPGHSMTFAGGDELHMSVMSSVFDGQHVVDVFNESPVDYSPFGNHEFDTGPEDCRAAVANSEFGWVSANVVQEGSGDAFAADAGAARYAIEELDGVRVGITGLAPGNAAEVTSLGENTEVLDPFDAAADVVADLEAEDVDLVVLLSHLASPTVEELVAEVDGFDLVVGDHAAFVSEGVQEINETLLSFVGDELDYLGQLDLEIVGGEIDGYEFERHDVVALAEEGEIDEHEAITDLHAGFNDELDEELGEVIGETETELDVRRETVRQRESGFGNYIADVIREDTDADVTIQNGGSIRGDRVYDPGDVTRRMVVDVLPFPNDTAAVELTGAELLQTLEHGVGEVEGLDGRFPQVSGMSYAYDPDASAGERVADVTVGGEPLDEEATYTVGTNDFLLGGGDGYEAIANAEVVRPPDEGQLLSAAVTLAIEADEVISPEPEGRIEVR